MCVQFMSELEDSKFCREKVKSMSQVNEAAVMITVFTELAARNARYFKHILFLTANIHAYEYSHVLNLQLQ